MMRKSKTIAIFLALSLCITAFNITGAATVSFNLNSGNISFTTVRYSLNISLSITNHGDVTANNMEIWIVLINNWTDNQINHIQRSILVSISPSPNATLTDVNNPNNVILYYKVDLSPGESFDISFAYLITLSDTKVIINENNIGEYNVSDEIYVNYTKAEDKIESNDSLIISQAASIVGNETNPYRKAKLIYNWVASHLSYELMNEEKGALWALQNLRGDCSEYTDLFVALCRAAGIPARKVTGWAISDLLYPYPGLQLSYTDMPGHAWAEIFIPNYGWVPADPTWGDAGYYLWGQLDAAHITAIRGQNVSVSNNNFTEFSGLYYRWLGSGSVSDELSFSINVLEVNTLPTFGFELILIAVVIVLVAVVASVLIKRMRAD